jgi:hypothetical protein
MFFRFLDSFTVQLRRFWLYRVSQEERSIFWEVIVSVILSHTFYLWLHSAPPPPFIFFLSRMFYFPELVPFHAYHVTHPLQQGGERGTGLAAAVEG